MCYRSVQLTSLRPHRVERHLGTQAERDVSAPLLLWPCTLRLSWEVRDDPEPNKTLRLGLPHRQKARLCLSVWQRRCCWSWIWRQDLVKKTWLGLHFSLQHKPNGKKDELLCSRQLLNKIKHMRLYAHHLARLCGIKGNMVLSEGEENRYHSNSFSFSSWM